ncbi:hypothetical protein SAMN04488134_102283 [Amphibacillus marinus]|uniref:CAAX prenyl protease 2/Lysostaphin resistance protein A-like domain-containing protein n=1 Tax=Amphibacillus marinus TaxID=872970 RepID=A0A1H8KHF1_9BACI|nr:CPBP family intramembrane glutamic endopeptidase [Amphibacillus marinus]SEN92006.1 hypothetical protein SAMN04488134_102283 [Amphibacillus marinus]
MDLLLQYSANIIPGLVLFGLVYYFIPKSEKAVRILLLIFGFVLIRDAMTPLKMWDLGVTDFVMWLRFSNDLFVVVVLGATSLLLTLVIIHLNKDFSIYLVWFGVKKGRSLLVGLIGAGVVILPFAVLNSTIPIELRGGEVANHFILAILWLGLTGNFLEEVLFRGYLQGYFAEKVGRNKAVFLSGATFAVGHTFLAISVTTLGIGILLFTLYEGLICAWVRKDHGIIAATLTHGLAIFFLATGLV